MSAKKRALDTINTLSVCLQVEVKMNEVSVSENKLFIFTDTLVTDFIFDQTYKIRCPDHIKLADLLSVKSSAVKKSFRSLKSVVSANNPNRLFSAKGHKRRRISEMTDEIQAKKSKRHSGNLIV